MPHRYRNIAISGQIAVGSTSLAKALSQKLGWPFHDGSQIFRDISTQAGFDLEKQVNEAISSRSDQIDIQVDQKTIQIIQSSKKVVVASKLVGFLSRDIKHTFKILVTAPLDIRIKRYSQDGGYPPEQAKQLIELREQEDYKKWSRLYDSHDFFNPQYFNLVLDSSKLSIEQEVAKILESLSNSSLRSGNNHW